MITVTNLHKYFQTSHALKGINLQVKQGEIYGFIGQNGAGKTTTLNILAGLSRPTQGECLVAGIDVKKIKHPSELPIGYLPEAPKFYPWLTAFETLAYLGNSKKQKVGPTRIKELLGWVGLIEASHRRVGGFSRGMQQRLGIAAALLPEPKLLILDEPSSALDPEGRAEVLQLILALKEMGKTVIFSTHILSDVERICDTVGIIADGKMVLEKPLKALQKDTLVPIFDLTSLQPWPEQIKEKLLHLPGVKHVEIKGTIASIMFTDAKTASIRLMHFLSREGLAVSKFVQRQHTLEDIFLREVKIT